MQNWFQNRRAKAKQEKKQTEFSVHQGLPYSSSASPEEFFPSVEFFNDEQFPADNSAPSGPSAPVASFNPRYEDPSAASIDSLQRTVDEAEAAFDRGDYPQDFMSEASFGGSLFDTDFAGDRAQFPASATPRTFAFGETEAYPSEAMLTVGPMTAPIPGYFVQQDNALPTFPSQLITSAASNNRFPAASYESQVPMPSSTISPEQAFSVAVDLRFKSPPPPTDIAARRSKPRPAALGSTALRGTVPMGPRSISTSDIPKRMTYSPTGSPMRRIQSNGGGMNVIGARIHKAYNVPQRSPMVRHFVDYMNETAMPAIPATASFQEFPPTPSSPYEKTHLSQSVTSASSPADSEPSYIFNTGVPGCFEVAENGSTMASPPETPHNTQMSHWAAFETVDEAIHTPGFGAMFGTEMTMQMQPQSFVSPMSASQPATPAFPTFGSYPYQHASPQFDFAVEQPQVEYHFPDGMNFPMMTSSKSPPSQLKNYTFSNLTQETVMEAQKKAEEREKTPFSKA
jgi:hypothetical protein